MFCAQQYVWGNLLLEFFILRRNKKLINRKLINIKKKYYIIDEDSYIQTLGQYKLCSGLLWLLGVIIAFYMDTVRYNLLWIILLFIICMNYVLEWKFKKNINKYLKKI